MSLASASIIRASDGDYQSERRTPAWSRLRQRLWQERQRRIDAAVAHAVRRLDHAGVSEDYRAACGRG